MSRHVAPRTPDQRQKDLDRRNRKRDARGQERPTKVLSWLLDDPQQADRVPAGRPPAPTIATRTKQWFTQPRADRETISADATRPAVAATQPADRRTVAQRLTHVGFIAAGLAAVSGASIVAGLTGSLPGWVQVPTLICVGLIVFTACLLRCEVKSALKLWALFVVMAIAGSGVYLAAHSDSDKGSEPAAKSSSSKKAGTPKYKLAHLTVPLGSEIRETIVDDNGNSWTLTGDHRVVGVRLDDGYEFFNRHTDPGAVSLRLCGDLVVTLTSGGMLYKYDALTGEKKGKYDVGTVKTWSCIGSTAWLFGPLVFIKLDLLAPPGHAVIKDITDQHLDVTMMTVRGHRVWGVDDNAPQLMAWTTTTQNNRFSGPLGEGVTGLALLAGQPYMLHGDGSCLRHLDRSTGTEAQSGVPLGAAPADMSSDGASIVAGETGGAVTLVELDRVTRWQLPIEGLRIKDIDLNSRYVVISDSFHKQLQIVARSDLWVLKPEALPTVPGCEVVPKAAIGWRD